MCWKIWCSNYNKLENVATKMAAFFSNVLIWLVDNFFTLSRVSEDVWNIWGFSLVWHRAWSIEHSVRINFINNSPQSALSFKGLMICLQVKNFFLISIYFHLYQISLTLSKSHINSLNSFVCLKKLQWNLIYFFIWIIVYETIQLYKMNCLINNYSFFDKYFIELNPLW